MLYTVNLDENGYILSISNTEYDSVELDLDTMELEYLNAYQIIDGKAVLDEKRKAELIKEEQQREKDEEIAKLVEELKATDEDMLDFLERLFSFKNPLTFISDMISLMKEYATLVANRQQIRKEIKEKMK